MSASTENRGSSVVWALAVGIIAWQLYVAGVDAVTDSGTLIRYGARKPNFHFPQAPWRLFASVFLHAGWVHLLANTFLLVTWGRVVARLLGPLAFLAAFLSCGFWGSLASDVLGPEALAIGASGATSGLVFLVLVLALVAKKRKGWQEESRQWFLSSAAVIGLNIGMALGSLKMAGAQLDHWAHLGGAAAGLLLGLFSWRDSDSKQRGYWAGQLLLSLAGVGVILWRGSTPFG